MTGRQLILGKTITIHDLASLTNLAYFSSFTVKNITSAFATPGIWPFYRLAFSDKDFEHSFVTDGDIPNLSVGTSVERPKTP